MNKYICPKDCPDRKVTADYNCHSHCESYEKYQAFIRLRRKIRWQQEQQSQATYEAKHKVRKIAERNERINRERGVKSK